MELFAYLDPGSASALLAAVLAGVAGLGAAIRTYGSNFLKRIMFWKKDEPEAGSEPGGGAADGESGAGETKAPEADDTDRADDSEFSHPEASDAAAEDEPSDRA
jgi:hypothetical protein